MKLDQLQNGFQKYVLHLDGGIEPFIRDGATETAAVRLEIYAEAYRLRLVEVLTDQYPALSGWLGPEDFDRLAIGYIDACPSRNFSVREFGAVLGDFLSHMSPYQERPALAEMARFEWALAGAFDAADIPSLQHEDLASIPAPEWPFLELLFHPGVRRL